MIKRILFLILLFGACSAGQFWVTILGYHKVMPVPQHNYDISTVEFEQQMNFIKDSYKIISLADLQRKIEKNEPLEGNSVVVTIDDGDKSIYTYAHPILKKLNIPYTFFIYTDVATERRAVTWKELIELSKDGVTIGSHTITHCHLNRRLAGETPEEYAKRVVKELQGSKKILEERLNLPVNTIAYPYGEFNDFVEKQTKDAGYELIFTTRYGRNYPPIDKYRLKRIMIFKDTSIEDFINLFTYIDKKKAVKPAN